MFDAIELVDRPWFPYLCTEVEYWQWESSGEPHFNFWVALSGEGYLSCEGQTFAIHPGRFFIFSPNQRIVAAHYSGARITRFSAHFQPLRKGVRLSNVIGLPLLGGDIGEALGVLQKQIDAIMRLAIRRDDDTELSQRLFRLLMQLSDDANLEAESSLDPQVAQAIGIFRESPASVRSMDRLAQDLGLSRSHFDRKFTAATGQAPNRFLLNCKMIHARRLLESSHLRIGEIAQTLGYRDIYFFSRQFKAHYGYAPLHYRQSLR